MSLFERHRVPRWTNLLAAALLLAWALPADGAPQDDERTRVVSEPQVTAARGGHAVRAFWRANDSRRMRDARELAMPLVDARQRSRLGDAAAPAATEGPMTVVTGSARGRIAPRVREIPQADLQATPRPGGPAPLAGEGPFAFTRYRLFPNLEAVYRTYPYRTVGKLFFTIDGVGFVCSASVVASASFSAVWTAGHCVYTPGLGFHENFLFVPAQRQVGTTPSAPFGEWTAMTAVTLAGWATLGLLEFDHGLLIMNRHEVTGALIGERVGQLGFIANAPRAQHWHLHGYPSAPHQPPSVDPQFSGFHHEVCAASWAADDQPTGIPGLDPPTIGVGCDQTGGSSGGPWILDLHPLAVSTSGGLPVALNLLNGNSSYRYDGGPPNTLELYGPYFSTAAINLRSFADNVDVP